MPFTPSAEYRSAPRNVVLAFARVPFYPFARRLIHVSIPRPPILLPIFYPPAPLPPYPFHPTLLLCLVILLRFSVLLSRRAFVYPPPVFLVPSPLPPARPASVTFRTRPA